MRTWKGKSRAGRESRSAGIPPDVAEDYGLPRPDIEQAKRLEPFYDLFRLFGLRSDQTITLCLAAIRTLARQTAGVFTRPEMEEALSYLAPTVRARVFRALEDYGWVANNGVRYEIPDRVRSLLIFLYSVVAGEKDFAQQIDVSMALTDLDAAAGNDDETSTANFEAAVGALRAIKAQLQRVLEQKSTAAAREALMKSERTRAAIDRVEKRLRRMNEQKYQYTLTTEVRDLCADIMNLHQDLLRSVHQDIQANARSFGEYLSPEQVEEFLHKAEVDQLARLIKRRWASPPRAAQLTRGELLQRGLAYLQHRPEVAEPVGPPPVTPVSRRDIQVDHQEGPVPAFRRQLAYRLRGRKVLPLPEAVVQGSFGETLFRTGLLMNTQEEQAGDPPFAVELDDAVESLPDGPVARMTRGRVKPTRKRGESE